MRILLFAGIGLITLTIIISLAQRVPLTRSLPLFLLGAALIASDVIVKRRRGPEQRRVERP